MSRDLVYVKHSQIEILTKTRAIQSLKGQYISS